LMMRMILALPLEPCLQPPNDRQNESGNKPKEIKIKP
jgi:hypothetical protein